MPLGIVPTGRRRTMIAQSYMSQPEATTGVEMGDVDPQVFEQQIQEQKLEQELDDEQPADNLEQQVDKAKAEQDDTGPPSLVKFIFDFMSDELGYPPRRLQEFKSQFVHESGAKGQPSQYTVTLPDQVYGSDSPIPNEKLKTIVNAIEQNFGISYQDYKRSDMKLILSFSSEDEAAREQMERGPGDILDQIYRSKGSGGDNSSKRAMTIQEMIKTSKNHNIQKLLKLLGGE